MVGKTLRFEDGAVQFRQRLSVSILTHRPLLIKNIRSDSLERPGLSDYEASFLRLLDTMMNGSSVEINSTGTQIRFKPGVLVGGDLGIHDCPSSRSIGWFLEGILPLMPFGKDSIRIRFSGVTDGTEERDPSCDYIIDSMLPILAHFGVGEDSNEKPTIQVVKRGAFPGGQGLVEIACPVVKHLRQIDILDQGRFKSVRGAVNCCRMSPALASRTVYASKGVLQRLLPDVWVTSNVSSKRDCGPSPGLSLTLTVESTTGVRKTVECCLRKRENGIELAEEIGERGAALLLEEVLAGGCFDTTSQSLVLLFMCLGPDELGRVRLGKLSHYSIESLRLFKAAFGIEFKLRADHSTRTVLLSCLGTGYRNMARAST